MRMETKQKRISDANTTSPLAAFNEALGARHGDGTAVRQSPAELSVGRTMFIIAPHLTNVVAC
nr:hypothetical protein SHINE37_42880 [Rhizobiaceae bacterium]